ncbi:MAG TPA: pyridoxamine 5'-phosphate oxidase [Thiotrichaceae bacterium]|jgi:predicted pyridoxine 5'-phosphate oxidase superfamily flavin-nucleotide-binding protein|nr:pyridoxamine 5'-phosphate oxidase [Thiotrichaceae bacterium]HIM07371.1 pyridoxamine 5'-phosphate oxidase [Gammaproteobacteria bacterium]
MREYTSDIAFTDTVKEIQRKKGSRNSYASMEQNGSWEYAVTPFLRDFIAARDSFYMASVNSDGYPYIQHRCGPKGFLKVIDQQTLGFADFRGNQQYISYGNLTDNNKVSLFLMDYPNKARIKVWGTAEVNEEDQELIERLSVSDYKAHTERAFIIHIEAWDRNCPQHITPRYTEEEISQMESIK